MIRPVPMQYRSHLDASRAEIEARIAECHESVREVVAYWREKAGDHAMPSRADIDPIELRAYLSAIILVDVRESPRDYIYRLVGTGEVAERGQDPTGKSVWEACYGTEPEEAVACYDYVVDHCSPFCYTDPYIAPDGRREREDIIFLPLSADGRTVNMVLVYSYREEFVSRLAAFQING